MSREYEYKMTPAYRKKYKYHPEGIRLLLNNVFGDYIDPSDPIDEIDYKREAINLDLQDTELLLLDTRGKVFETWAKRHTRGVGAALKVFDGLWCEYYHAEIAKNNNLTRERVRQISEILVELPCMQKLKQNLQEISCENREKLDALAEGKLFMEVSL